MKLWRPWKRGMKVLVMRTSRNVKSSGWVVALATCFAAIAAGLSVVVALRQERATFTSALYNRQVDAIGALSEASERFAVAATTFGSQCILAIQIITGKRHDIVTGKGLWDPTEFERSVAAVDLASNSADLVLPEDYRLAVDSAMDNADEVLMEFQKAEIKDFKSDRRHWQSLLSRCRGLSAQDTVAVEYQYETIKECAYASFIKGEPLSGASTLCPDAWKAAQTRVPVQGSPYSASSF